MKLYLQDPKWGKTTVFRQTSQFSGCIGQHNWTSFPDERCDYFICSDPASLPKNLFAQDRKNRVFVMHENPYVWKPSVDFLESYGIVISPFRFAVPSHILFIQAHSAVPWFYGIPFDTNSGLLHRPGRSLMELDALGNQRPFNKSKLISMFVSGKSGLVGHQWRIQVAKAITNLAGKTIDIYGFGHNPLLEKSMGLDKYRFSVVIENSCSEYYWTEKLADCLLGGAIPIYSGATRARLDLGWELPEISFGCDPENAARQIMAITEKHLWHESQMNSLRELILYNHNLFNWIPTLLEQYA